MVPTFLSGACIVIHAELMPFEIIIIIILSLSSLNYMLAFKNFLVIFQFVFLSKLVLVILVKIFLFE
jgi:hypothetical protein